MASHLVTALLGSGDWCVRITDLGPQAALSPAESDGLLGAALRDGRAAYFSVDVCELAQLTKALEGVDTVFHTAAADHTNNNFQLHYKVNVEAHVQGMSSRLVTHARLKHSYILVPVELYSMEFMASLA